MSVTRVSRLPNLLGVLTDGDVVDASVERGLACNCICPGGNQPLMAKQGDIRAHYFCHVGDRTCIKRALFALCIDYLPTETRNHEVLPL